MPAGISRSPFLVPLAKAVDLSPQQLRDRLNREGYKAPYLDEERALKVLEKLNISTQAYRRRRMLKGEPEAKEGSEQKKTAKKEKKFKRGGLTPEGRKKASATFAKQLIRRLAAVLPEKNPSKAKYRAVKILRSAEPPYYGPRWDDEARAVAIFKAAGIKMDKFQYEPPPHTNGASRALVVAAPHADADAVVISDGTAWLVDAAQRARMNLQQFENRYFEMMEQKLIPRTIPEPLDYVWNALNILRGRRRK
jgi:hypothetical protein